MAIGNNTSGDVLTRTASLPSPTAFAACGWGRMTSNRDSWDTLFILMSSGGASFTQLAIPAGSGTFSLALNSGNVAFSANPDTNRWFQWYVTADATTTSAGWRYAEESTWRTASGGSTSFTSATMSVLNENSGGAYWDGYAANVKVWGATLTEAELTAEFASGYPLRYANLHLWTPLWRVGDSGDYSGNGRDWTATGTLLTDGHPPLTMTPAAGVAGIEGATGGGGVTGTIAITGNVGAVAMEGQPIIHGTMAITGSGGTVAMAGQPIIHGTLAITGSGGTVAMEGQPIINGTLAITGSGGAVAMEGGPIIHGTLAVNGSGGTVAMEGGSTIHGTIAITGNTGAVAMEGQPIIHGTLAITGSGGTVAMREEAGDDEADDFFLNR